MKKLIFNTTLFFLPVLIIFLIIVISYIKFDPFMVLRTYNNYYAENQEHFGNKANLDINRDMVSTMTLCNNSDNIKYNSYILGNSRSMFYNVTDWKKHLPDDAVCFHFNAFGESIWALQKKVDFLDKNEYEIRDVLLTIDYSTLIADKPTNSHLNIITPRLMDYDNIMDFHITFFKTFCDVQFIYGYFDMLLSKKYKPYMRKKGIVQTPIACEVLTNEYRCPEKDSLILKEKYYTENRITQFYKRPAEQTFSPVVIGEKQLSILNEIRTVFGKHKNKYKVIINPLYDQKKLNEADLIKLHNVFGQSNVYDFSGINDITNDFHNYYETLHYLPSVATLILNSVYK